MELRECPFCAGSVKSTSLTRLECGGCGSVFYAYEEMFNRRMGETEARRRALYEAKTRAAHAILANTSVLSAIEEIEVKEGDYSVC